MTYRVWFEWLLPADLMAMLDGLATVAGPATDTPATPFVGLPGAHAAIASGLRYDAAMMDLAPDLLVISRTGIGYDNVDVAAATARGIAVCNTPDGPTTSTAEHTFALLLAVAKKLKRCDTDIRSLGGRRDYYRLHEGLELLGTTLGLVGLGRIGGSVARFARAFGMQVIAYDPFISDEAARALEVERVPTLEALLPRADVISLHLPLLPETRKVMNAARFALMKPGALFINAARGGLVDEAALIEALVAGRLGGAGLDVTDPEPPDASNPLLARDDVIVTPHIASATGVGKRRIQDRALSQVVEVLRGERPPHLINTEVWPRVLARRAALSSR